MNRTFIAPNVFRRSYARAYSTALSYNTSSPRAPLIPGNGKSHWKTTEAVPLSRESFLALLYGETPLIKSPGFLSPDECWKYEKLLSPLLEPYKYNTGPLLRKIGVAQFEYQAQRNDDFNSRTNEQDQYFQDASQWLDFHSRLRTEHGLDAWFRVFDKITTMFPDWDVQVASERHGKTYFSGIFRALNDATHLHVDFSPYDSSTEDWIINSVECQAVFNLYLAPVKGGITTVHDVQWTKEALKYRDPESYGYDRSIAVGARKAYCEPTVGALCMFNSRNMHEVDAVKVENMPSLGLNYRPRLTLSSFMGLIPSSRTKGRPRLIFWS
ncbi:uncharacterized protein JN550_005747 [Neoarthrinium moseri]|uniref:uncharacterized protein n=1 Tax=Neoarthrinium moseri TaxID=1658444 RepID=UPI001FDD6F76|nr:uncharacterized protein JN550_005747 [Neoarthrinium moseri]KAI1869766.1 hypothetical protein JN550_005747 [Neoarthrinium moseri]